MFSYDVEKSEISIYDEIGPSKWGLVDASMVADALQEMNGKHVTIRLNTPGGSVDDGIAIYNAIKRHKGGTTTVVDSLAASMGSYIMQAADRRVIAANAMVMVHDPWSIAVGNATEFRKMADVLDKYAQRMIPDYAKRSGRSEDQILDIMAEESWYVGQEAIDAGFADELEGENHIEPVLKGLQDRVRNAPAALFAKRDEAVRLAQQADGFPRRQRIAAIAAQLRGIV